MKKLLFIFILLVSATFNWAQTDEGLEPKTETELLQDEAGNEIGRAHV